LRQLSSFKVSSTYPPVVIIGASAAGLYAACLLAKGGVPVYLFDEREQWGPPSRTLIVTPHIQDVLGCIPSEAIVNRTSELQLFSPQRSATIRLSQPDWIVEREKLIQMLARQARAAGAELLPGYRFLGLEPVHGGLVVRLESSRGRIEHLRTRVLIGADGVFSGVAGAVQRDHHPTVSILQAQVVLPPGTRADTTQVWFEPPSTRYFYWLMPEARDHAAVGLIADDECQAREGLQRFLSIHDLEPLGYQGAQVPLYSGNGRPWRKISGAQVFLVGDAAAQVKVTTVGGVVTGLRGARAAAQAILQGSNDSRELGALQRELDLHRLVRSVLNRFAPSDYDQLLGLVNARTQRVLGAHTRDEICRVLLPLLLVQPRLLLLAAGRFLFRSAESCQRT